MSEVSDKLENRISESLDSLADVSIGSEEHKDVLEEIKALYNLKNKSDELQIQEARDWEQLNAEREKQESDHELREKQIDLDFKKLKHEKIALWAGLGVTGGITIGTLVYENKGGLIPRPLRSLLDKVTRRM